MSNVVMAMERDLERLKNRLRFKRAPLYISVPHDVSEEFDRLVRELDIAKPKLLAAALEYTVYSTTPDQWVKGGLLK